MMTTQTNFMEFYPTTDKAAKGTVKMASVYQVKYYNDLCEQRKVEPKDVTNLTYDELSNIISELKSFYPATQPQIDLINLKVKGLKDVLNLLSFNDEQIAMFERDESNIAHMIVAGILRNTLELDTIIEKLTGGRTGTASALIEKLIVAEKYFVELEPVTDEQASTIASMFLCPDVQFESYDISRRIKLDGDNWRKPTPQEFTDQIKEVFNKKTASEFIGKMKVPFYEWKKTRIRPNQLKRIMQLESQIANDSKLREVKKASDIHGGEIDTPSTKVPNAENIQIKGTAYVQHTDQELIQLDIETASAFISQLESELTRASEYSLEEEIQEIDRGTASIVEQLEKDHEILNNMMYKLEAIAGYDDPELHECSKLRVLSDFKVGEYEETYIRDFIKNMLSTGAITYYGIMELALESTILQQILLNM